MKQLIVSLFYLIAINHCFADGIGGSYFLKGKITANYKGKKVILKNAHFALDFLQFNKNGNRYFRTDNEGNYFIQIYYATPCMSLDREYSKNYDAKILQMNPKKLTFTSIYGSKGFIENNWSENTGKFVHKNNSPYATLVKDTIKQDIELTTITNEEMKHKPINQYDNSQFVDTTTGHIIVFKNGFGTSTQVDRLQDNQHNPKEYVREYTFEYLLTYKKTDNNIQPFILMYINKWEYHPAKGETTKEMGIYTTEITNWGNYEITRKGIVVDMWQRKNLWQLKQQ